VGVRPPRGTAMAAVGATSGDLALDPVPRCVVLVLYGGSVGGLQLGTLLLTLAAVVVRKCCGRQAARLPCLCVHFGLAVAVRGMSRPPQPEAGSLPCCLAGLPAAPGSGLLCPRDADVAPVGGRSSPCRGNLGLPVAGSEFPPPPAPPLLGGPPCV
jgi:hypothetical protein